MTGTTRIEWTDSTWNPVTGCTQISPGCDHCYAKRFAERFKGVAGNPYEQGFALTLHAARLDQPKRWRKPRHVFVNSMSDLFHTGIPPKYVDQIFDVMEDAAHHVYQVLTKRSGRMRHYLAKRYAARQAPAHIWMGVSVEDRKRKARIRHLQDSPASVRFLSLEPLLEDLETMDLEGIHWVIAGGESGPRARRMEEGWVRNIRDQCAAAKVAFFFKQWGGLTPKSGGRSLDGRTYDDKPGMERG